MYVADAPDGFVKDTLEVPLGEGRALHVFGGLDLFGNCNGLFVLYRGHLLLPESLFGSFIISQIQLGSNEDDGYARRMVLNLGVPL